MKQKKIQLNEEEQDLCLRILTAYFFHIKPTSIYYCQDRIEAAKALYQKLKGDK